MGSRAVHALSLRHCRAFNRFRSSLASHLPSPAFMACRSNPQQEEVSQLITILAEHFQVFSPSLEFGADVRAGERCNPRTSEVVMLFLCDTV